MSAKYSTSGTGTAGATATCVSIDQVATNHRPIVYEIIFGTTTAPADAAMLVKLWRFTVDGTATAVVPLPLDPASPATTVTGGEDHSVEPTYTAAGECLQFGLNQQATFRWVVPPDEGFVIPATADNGIGIQVSTISAGTPTMAGTILHVE